MDKTRLSESRLGREINAIIQGYPSVPREIALQSLVTGPLYLPSKGFESVLLVELSDVPLDLRLKQLLNVFSEIVIRKQEINATTKATFYATPGYN